MRKFIVVLNQIIVYGFALIGFILVGGYFAVKYGLTDTEGEEDINSAKYQEISLEAAEIAQTPATTDIYQKEAEEKQLFCKIDVISYYAPENASKLLETYENTLNQSLAIKMIFALSLRLSEQKNYLKDISQCTEPKRYEIVSALQLKTKLEKTGAKGNAFPWIDTEDWDTVIKAIAKDKASIITASQKADVDPRIIVAVCIVEQLRLYNTQREMYEKFFKPLEILGNANKMAWGVMSIKENTAIKIENNLYDTGSDYYLGAKYQSLLEFNSDNPSAERYQRLTDDNDHYYSYLYGALYIKQILHQWQKAGFDISHRPEIIATLFNLGFNKSQPKADPIVGGSTIEINNVKYTFGSLAYEFYYSGEMMKDYIFITSATEET